MKAIFLCNQPATVDRVYAAGRREKVARLTELHEQVVDADGLLADDADFSAVEVVFSTWGMPKLSEAHARALPNLKAVFYAAGSVRGFADPLLARDILLVSAWQANAVPVAEFTLAQILLANKLYFANAARCSSSYAGRNEAGGMPIPGNFGETVALLGAGAIGRKLIELLKPFHLRLVVWDPFLTAEAASQLGVEKIDSLEDAFSQALTVSNHLANVPETVGLLREDHFRMMRPNATFINTGRGATVDEPGLARVFAERPDLTALLDVTFPEPPQADSPFYELPNIRLTSHIAGSLGDEVVRMADYVIDEFEAWREGGPLKYQVTRDILATMA